MILSRFVRLFLLNLPCADKDDTAESRKYHPFKMAAQEAQRKTAANFLSDLPAGSAVAELFSNERLNAEEMAKVVDLCVRPQNNVSYQPGEYIIRQGDVGHDFFILKAGEAVATIETKAGDEQKTVKEYGPGSFFGELALQEVNGRRSANVIATGVTGAACLTISREDFNMLIGEADDILARSKAGYDKVNASLAR